jgi:putative ABC transport system substrate-binding protein
MKEVRDQVSKKRGEKFMSKKVIHLALSTILLALCLSAEAQQPTKIPRIGYVTASSRSTVPTRIEAFQRGMRELGYVEDKTVAIEWRFGDGKPERLPGLVAELVRLKVDVIVTGGPSTNASLRKQPLRFPLSWRTIPILLATGLSPALRDLAGISLDCQLFPRRLAENNWSF